MRTLTPRPVVSLDELYDGAVRRDDFFVSDSKSGSPFERLTMTDGSTRIVKHVHVDHDWTMRFNGDIGCHPAQVWRSGLMDVLPERIEHGVLAVATGLGRHGWGAAILMEDLSSALVPPGDDVIPLEQHATFIEDMARLSARTLNWRDDVGLVPLGSRWTWFNHATLSIEEAFGWPEPVPKIAHDGWMKFEARAPRDVVEVIDALRRDSSPLVERAQATPMSFVHGDWKLGNVGLSSSGRTVLIDWTYPGEAPCCSDLVWYLAVNRSRMPESKEDTAARFERTLRAEGTETDQWFDAQLALSLLGGCLVFGWEKAYGDEDELQWWCDRAREGAALL